MIVKAFTLISLASYAIGELCVNYDFERGFNDLFNSYGVCDTFPLWTVSKYEEINMIGINGSKFFITPSSLQNESCASSFTFLIQPGGTVEIDIYMERSDVNDQIRVFISQILPDGGSFIRQYAPNKGGSLESGYFVNGWQTLKVFLVGTDTYEGFISIAGKASKESIVLVDAFRYIPAKVDESYCRDTKNVFTPISKAGSRTTTTTRRSTTTTGTTTTTWGPITQSSTSTTQRTTTTTTRFTTKSTTRPDYNATVNYNTTTSDTMSSSITGFPPITTSTLAGASVKYNKRSSNDDTCSIPHIVTVTYLNVAKYK